ncbi:hypothetical protein [Streptomyces sp. NBC_00878]|uniref:hypothetical protein n=1 Tax=Streptomyces sp. NBC_00878 TaxID=2975854 RepID=UPI002251C6A5|nr:hypothetical protein [Streptomyces sp. NBC_00878]MCX4906834.1 hypothetical protein [Streptomyces sp. NBC_00878]
MPEPTEPEMAALIGALYGAIQPLAQAMRRRMTSDAHDNTPWDDTSMEAALATLAAWRPPSDETERLAARSARIAGAKGASYAALGAAWKISRQAARKRWPGAVLPEKALAGPSHFKAFGGEALTTWRPEEGTWWWIANAASGQGDEAPEEATYSSSEEAAAGAFLAANATTTREATEPSRLSGAVSVSGMSAESRSIVRVRRYLSGRFGWW